MLVETLLMRVRASTRNLYQSKMKKGHKNIIPLAAVINVT